MSSHFSANQYEDAFNPKKLKNWTVPRRHKERPSTLEGFTQIIATDRGHLKPDVPRSKESPWGTFMGTWDMPRQIPPSRPSYTARSLCAADNLARFKETSSLNEAVNGYKEFGPARVKRSPIQRPKTPSPPASCRAPHPAAGAPPTPEKVPSPRKSSSPRVGSKRGSPMPASAPRSPVRMINADSPHKPPSPTLSVKSASLPGTPDSGRPRTGGSQTQKIAETC